MKLYNNIEMPEFIYGTYLLANNEESLECTKYALEIGFKHIDTAEAYKNEEFVGKGIKAFIENGGEKPFITTKCPNWNFGYDACLKAFESSKNKLGLDIDLYLLHDPAAMHPDSKRLIIDSWRALEKLYKEGRVKAIGVSNFAICHLEFLLKNCEIKPMVNQIELHPQHQNKKLVNFCKNNDIAVTSWGALNQGRIFKEPLVAEIAQKYKKSVSQIALKWSLEKGFCPIFKSAKKERIFENYNVFDFNINVDDIQLLDTLDGGEFSGWLTEKQVPPETILLSEIENVFYNNAKNVKIKLFGFIPFVQIKRKNRRIAKVYLFGLPILKIDQR